MRRLTPNYEKLRLYFLGVPAHKVAKTFEHTTQMATYVPHGHHMFHTRKSPYPGLNAMRRFEPVATDTIESDTTALNGGYNYA